MKLAWTRRAAAVAVAGLWLLLATGCGAGLITGAAVSGDSGGSATPRTPTVTIGNTLLPLVPVAGSERSVIITDAQLPVGAAPEVRLSARGAVDQQSDVRVADQSGSTVIRFRLVTSNITARVPDPTAEDVAATLEVLVGGERLASPVPVTLVRRPRAVLRLDSGQTELFVSPAGELVTIEVDGLLGTDADDVQVLISTPDPEATGRLVRAASEVSVAPASIGPSTVRAVLPGNSFTVGARVIVQDAIAGESTWIENVYYRPSVSLALPSQGPTTGGTPVTLIGTALAPYDFSTRPARIDFARVSLTLVKGGRVIELPRDDFLTGDSGLDRLVFTMPPSPDGRPEQVDIVLRVQLENTEAVVVAGSVFLFANPDPFYGPRGAVFEQQPVASVPIRLDNAPSTVEAPDFALLTEQGGVGFVQLLLAQQNGMFQPFRAPRQIGDHEVAAERRPRDLLAGDFDGDDVPDLLVVNEGSVQAVHHVVLGQVRPEPPLGVVHRVTTPGGYTRGRVADLDNDGLVDVLLVPGPMAPAGSLPLVLLARPLGAGMPAFAAPMPVDLRAFAYEAFEVADFDDDQVLDLAFVSGSELRMDVVFGVGDGTFVQGQQLDFSVVGYTADAQSRAVGLHACRNQPRQSLALVLAGIDGSTATQPTIAVLRQEPIGGGVEYVDPTAANVYTAPVEPIGQSLVANLDEGAASGTPEVEMVVAIRGDPTLVALGLLKFGDEVFEPIEGSIEAGLLAGAEAPVQIRSLAAATAFPETQPSGEANAVFIVHEVDVDGSRERRLSTRLVGAASSGEPILLPPDAGARIDFEIEGVVGGNFSAISVAGNGEVRDLALASKVVGEEVAIVLNDGFGGVRGFGRKLSAPGLLPPTVTLVPTPQEIEPLVYLDATSRLGYWRHDPAGDPLQPPDFTTPPLRDLLAGTPLAGAVLDENSRLYVADFDGDGLSDVLALLSFAVPSPGDDDCALVLLRGRAVGPDELPFVMPTRATRVHGNATSLAIADFAGSPTTLEVAVTVPRDSVAGLGDGDHVRFYRLEAGSTPAEDRFVASAMPGGRKVLLAGSAPTLCAADDFDRDGRADLLVACQGDSTLRLFRNTTVPGSGAAAGEVDVDAFVEALTSPEALSPGLPTTLRLGDVNGDGNLDVVCWTEFVDLAGVASTAIATYLSTGTGGFGDARFASRTRIGEFDGRLSGDLGDWNRDGVPDLLLGWGVFEPQNSRVNLRVLFGGTR